MKPLDLSGVWEVGDNRVYNGTAAVPSLPRDPAAAQSGTLWYRRRIRLPGVAFVRLMLILKGARFRPAVYVNGDRVSQAEGGMAPTRHLFSHPACRPGAEVTVEICLSSQSDVPPSDASRIPEADAWRTDVSSGLWDVPLLYPCGGAAVTRILPDTDLASRVIRAHMDVDRVSGDAPYTLTLSLTDAAGNVLAQAERLCRGEREEMALRLPDALPLWDEGRGNVFRLRAEAECEGITSSYEIGYGAREFTVRDKRFYLNGRPVTLRGITVVWHRFCRDAEGRTLAFDREWMREQILGRLCGLGGNYLRFHLGLPPESFLDLCDSLGILVQAEWHFFHGVDASGDSLLRQWRDFFTVAAAHPSVCVVHPWNETDEERLCVARKALARVAAEFPQAVVSHRDVVHIHKYWWSLFENLTLSYDGPEQFPKAVMMDEFGGNYLDGEGNVGGYPEAAHAFERFLGPEHTKAQRLALQAEANARVAEYCRRIGLAGFATFCALGSPEDGNHHFLGGLSEGRPKPVWEACRAAFAARSVSLELWDRCFEPGASAEADLVFFNDTDEASDMTAEVFARDGAADGILGRVRAVRVFVPARGRERARARFELPAGREECALCARLAFPPVPSPPESRWSVRLICPRPPAALAGRGAYLLDDDPELRTFARNAGLRITSRASGCDIMLGGGAALHAADRDAALRGLVSDALRRGKGVLLINAGPQWLGEGYLADAEKLAHLDGLREIRAPRCVDFALPMGLSLRFSELPEPESCCHFAEGADFLRRNMGREALRIANGTRGGLIVPAADMEAEGISGQALLSQWRARGADPEKLAATRDYTAYELAGHYAFGRGNDETVGQALRNRVRFLVQDSPALKGRVDPEGPIRERNLSAEYASCGGCEVLPLLRCGRKLARTAALLMTFPGGGRMLVSQVMTAGRLAPGYGGEGLYGVRYDPEIACLTHTMMAAVLRNQPANCGSEGSNGG